MKYLALLLAFTAPVFGATLTLNSGEVIEIYPDEKIYISRDSLYTLGQAASEVQRDSDTEPPLPTPDTCSPSSISSCVVGSVKYCTFYQDKRASGISFEDQAFLRACDTNDDGEYRFCDDYKLWVNGFTFIDQTFLRNCSGNGDFNPIFVPASVR